MATTYDYDINYFIFEIDITKDNTVIQLKNNRRGDTTEWDNITYWGDGISDTNTTHTYNIGKYTIKSKLFTYRDNESGVNSNRYVTNVFSINKNITDCYRLFYDCNKLTSLDLSNFDTSNVTNMYAMFSNCLSLTSLDVSNFDTSKVTNMRSMFNSCRLLTSLDLSNFDTSNVVTMYTMFYDCRSLTSLNVSSFNTSKVTTMAEMFKGCLLLTSLDVSNFDTSKVTTMAEMFENCSKLTSLDLSNFNTSKVTDMKDMFYSCKSLTSLDLSNFDTSKVTDMRSMFCNCLLLVSLDISSFNTSNVTNMGEMFKDCNKLISLDVSNFDTSKVTSMGNMFKDCLSLTLLDVSNFDTSKVQYMDNMFNGCSKLTVLNLSNFNTINVTTIDKMFKDCDKLTSLDLSNFNTINVTTMQDVFYKTPQLQDIGMVYCTKATIEKVSSLIQHTANIYVNSVIPENCTPVEGITFIYDGNIKEMTHEPLRAVGDVKDRYVLIDGKWYIERNCKEDIVDGTEEGWTPAETTESHSKFYLDMYGIRNEAKGSLILSDKFAWGEHTTIPTYEYIRIENDLDISISNSTLSTQDVSGFKQWLQQNPLTVIYQLSTPTYEPIDYNPLEVYSDVTHITTNSTIPCNVIVKNHGYNLVTLKENTQYTLYVNKDTTNTLTYRLGDYIEVTAPSKFTFTTPATLTDKTLRIDGKGAKVNDLMLIEGTPANDSIGYFDGLKSSYECEQVTDENDENYGKYKVDIKVVGKNKLNIPSAYITWKGGKIAVTDGNIVTCTPASDGTQAMDYQTVFADVDFKKGTQLTLSATKIFGADYTSGSYGIGIYLRDARGSLISGGAYRCPDFLVDDPIDTVRTTTITLTQDVAQIGLYIIAWKIQGASGDYKFKVQIEEGDIATEYEPYFESKQTIYLNSPLLKGDEIVWKDNKIQHYHKMNKVVLDGSDDEGWGSAESKGNNIKFGKAFNNAKYFALHKCPLKCDNFITQSAIFDESLYEMATIYCHSEISKELRLSICKSKLQTQDLQGFKQWLQQNPTTVVYPLETPYYEEISDYPLKLNVIANSSLSTESTIQVTNISFNIYEETLPYLYPNTKYYITFNADVDRNNIIIDLGGSHVVFDCKVGFNKVEITTPSDTTNLLTFSGTGVNIDHVKVTQQDIDEYFEGMKSVGECEGNVIEIILQNKNLFDGETESGVYSFADGVTVDENDNYSRTVNYINVKDIDKITISSNQTTYGFRVYLYDANKKHIENIIVYSNNSLNVSKASYIRMIYNSKIDKNTIQIETGTEVTSSCSYTSNKQQLTHEPLRAVGNVKDKYIMIDGKWYIERNCAEVVLNKDNCTLLGNGGISSPKTQVYQHIPNNLGVVNSKNIISDIVPTHESAWWSDIKCITLNADGYIQFRMLPNEYLTTSQRVIYKLQTPVYEPIDYNPFETYADITHISTNSLIPTNVVVKNHGYNCILKPSTKYTVALNKPNGTISAKLGGSAKVDSTNSIFTITTPSTLNDNVLRLSGSGNVKDIMILEGDKTVNTPSYFEGIESVFEQEYDVEKGKYRVTARVEGNGKESSIAFYINEPLRSVGDIKDRVFIQDGKVIVERNCGSVTFDGSEIWIIDNSSSKCIEFNNKIIARNSPLKCNLYPLDLYGDFERICCTIYGIYIRISKAKLQTQDVAGFKQWLQQNPTIVVYQLVEPVYEEADCDLSKLVLENYENSSLIFESNIPVSANIRYSGEVPVVTQAKTLSSKVDNTTLDINENIIPYMCDIDYRIVELQLMNGDTQGEGIELLGIGDIEILGNENVLFNNREDKKHNFSYDMLKRDILSQRYSKEEYRYRLDRYLLANKISDEEYKELEGLLNNGK